MPGTFIGAEVIAMIRTNTEPMNVICFSTFMH